MFNRNFIAKYNNLDKNYKYSLNNIDFYLILLYDI